LASIATCILADDTQEIVVRKIIADILHSRPTFYTVSDSKAKSTAMAIIASARKSSRSASGSPEGYDAGIVQEVIEKGRTRKDGAKKGGEGRREWRCPLGDD